LRDCGIAGFAPFDVLEYLVVERAKKREMRRRCVAAGGSCGCKEAGDCGANAVDSCQLVKGKLFGDLSPQRRQLGHRCKR
jgi:hypothetical protein